MYLKLKGFKIFKDRNGHMRCYHRSSGTAIDLKKFPLHSPIFIAEATRISNSLAPLPQPKAGTLGQLKKKYKESAQYKALKPKTQAFYEDAFEFLTPMNDTPLSA